MTSHNGFCHNYSNPKLPIISASKVITTAKKLPPVGLDLIIIGSRDPNSFIFMQFSAKNWKITPTWELAPPPQENPGSITVETFRSL